MREEDEWLDLERRCIDGERDAWERLWQFTHVPLLRSIKRTLHDPTLAEDALQITFARAVERIHRFNPARAQIDA